VVVLIDNYDSFTWNLYALIASFQLPVRVFRNDKTGVAEIQDLQPTGIMISPGPGRPEQSGISSAVLDAFTGKIPVLGICLGHQLICAHYGAHIRHAPEVRHGKTSSVQHTGTGLFSGLPAPLEVMRYHSLIADRQDFPEELEINAWTEDNIIMGVQHKFHNLAGLQFHPESILTPLGSVMIQNWLGTLKQD